MALIWILRAVGIDSGETRLRCWALDVCGPNISRFQFFFVGWLRAWSFVGGVFVVFFSSFPDFNGAWIMVYYRLTGVMGLT